MVKLLDDVGGVLLVPRGAEERVSLAVLGVDGADGGRGGEVEEQEEKDEDEDDCLHAAVGDPGELIFFLLLLQVLGQTSTGGLGGRWLCLNREKDKRSKMAWFDQLKIFLFCDFCSHLMMKSFLCLAEKGRKTLRRRRL